MCGSVFECARERKREIKWVHGSKCVSGICTCEYVWVSVRKKQERKKKDKGI